MASTSGIKKLDETALQIAAEQNNVPETKRLLSLGVDVNAKDQFGRTPLHLAATYNKRKSHFESIELLLNNGADVNAKTETGTTPLQFLIKNAEVEIVELLLKFGADINTEDDESRLLLFDAVKVGNYKIVRLLIDNGSDINRADENGFTPLLMAAVYSEGESELCKLLLKSGADVNAQDKFYGRTALHVLVGKVDVYTVQLFLNFRADVNIKNNDGEIPLFGAIRANNVEVVQLLLDHGSDVNIINDSERWTLLHAACEYDCSIEIIKSLLKKGLDANAPDTYGYTPLMLFMERPNPDPVSLTHLLKYADVNFVYSSGMDILRIKNRDIILKLILEHIAKLQALDIALHPSIFESICENEKLKNYFEKCTKELTEAKITKLQDCWVTFFNLLVDSKRKLKNYAGNKKLVEQFGNSDCKNKFPIYGALMKKNVTKAMRMRKFFDDSAELLSNCLPCFGPTHLIVRDTLDCLVTKDLLKICSKNM